MDDEVCRNLWSAVLKQAIKDASEYHCGFFAERALSWFEDESKEIGSFQWICSILNLNPESIKRVIYQVTRESNSISANNSPMESCAH